MTVIEQAVAGFTSPYSGENSFDAHPAGRELADASLSAGFAPWPGGQIWFDPEAGQGRPLGDSRGVAGYIDAEAPRSGVSAPYVHVQRLFLRQTFGLGGRTEAVDADEDQLSGARDVDRIDLTVGRFSVVDIFDLNDFAR